MEGSKLGVCVLLLLALPACRGFGRPIIRPTSTSDWARKFPVAHLYEDGSIELPDGRIGRLYGLDKELCKKFGLVDVELGFVQTAESGEVLVNAYKTRVGGGDELIWMNAQQHILWSVLPRERDLLLPEFDEEAAALTAAVNEKNSGNKVRRPGDQVLITGPTGKTLRFLSSDGVRIKYKRRD